MINDREKITIITVVYNGAEHIEQTMTSILEQSYPNIEYIVIDGGSVDGSVDIIRKYADRLAYWTSEPDRGIYDAMNKGLSRATGEMIGIQNSDDWYEPGAFSLIIDQYRRNGEAIYYGLQKVFDSIGEREIRSMPASRLAERMIPHSTCFVPKSIYEKIGLFDSDLCIAADYKFMLKAQTAGVRFVQVERVLSNIRRGGISTRQSALARYETVIVRACYGFASSKDVDRAKNKFRIAKASAKFRSFFRPKNQS